MGPEDRSGARPADARGALPAPGEDLEGRERAVEARRSAVEGRETAVEGRETAVEARERAVEARDATHDERMEIGFAVRAAGDERDAVAGARDAAADKREHDLDRVDLLNLGSDYGANWPERRNAGIDRTHAKEDRAASHDDRVALTEAAGEDDPDGT